MVVVCNFPPAAATSLVLLLLGLCRAQLVPDFQEMKMNGKTQIVSLNADVTIPCELFYDGSLMPNISVTGVRWFWRRLNSDKEDKIFEYNGGKQTQFRTGANISMSGLRRGDASLFLPLIQFQEGGEYRCEIIVPPATVERISRLDVVAQPSSILLPRETVVEEKKAYILECTVTGFYPESVNITWKKVIPGPQSLDVDNSEEIYTSSIRNTDGTFNATSRFILHPILEDRGTIYKCVVVHKSLLIPLHSSTMLFVTAGEQQEEKSEKHSVGSDHLETLPP